MRNRCLSVGGNYNSIFNQMNGQLIRRLGSGNYECIVKTAPAREGSTNCRGTEICKVARGPNVFIRFDF